MEESFFRTELEKVSIVIPVYKVEDVIIHCLQSVVNQTYKNIELILVNDGTPDNSIQVAESYLAGKQLTWKVVNQVNMGLPTARNNGIKEASGEWVICPDSDDVIAPDAIEKMLGIAHKYNVDCVFCGFKIVTDENYDMLPKMEGTAYCYDVEYAKRQFLYRNLILLAPGMLLRKRIYDLVQYDPLCPYDEDIHFIWQLFYVLKRIGYTNSDLYNYYSRSSSMVHTLKPERYLQTSSRYKILSEKLSKSFPKDKYANLIWARFKLGGLHVLSRSTNYKTFRQTAIKDNYRNGMIKLICQPNLRLSLYASLLCSSLALFYVISKR